MEASASIPLGETDAAGASDPAGFWLQAVRAGARRVAVTTVLTFPLLSQADVRPPWRDLSAPRRDKRVAPNDRGAGEADFGEWHNLLWHPLCADIYTAETQQLGVNYRYRNVTKCPDRGRAAGGSFGIADGSPGCPVTLRYGRKPFQKGCRDCRLSVWILCFDHHRL